MERWAGGGARRWEQPRQARAERHWRRILDDPRQARISAGALQIWVVLLILPALDGGDRGALAVAGLVGFGAAYVVLMGAAVHSMSEQRPIGVAAPGWVQAALLSVLVGIAIATAVGYGGDWLALFILTSMACAAALPGAAPPLAGVLATGYVCLGLGISVDSSGVYIGGTFSAGFIIWLLRQVFRGIAEVQRAREELAVAAVGAERLRFARDVHDLLGHTLSVIVVKSEVVRRLAPIDADRAAREAAEIEEVGRRALAEIREAVTGYRERGLVAELDDARGALEAAGVQVTIRTAGLPAPIDVDAVLAFVVREGVTNVIRHAQAARCRIDVERVDGRMSVDVVDDGVGGAVGHNDGNGLRGLSERVESVGGRLSAAPGRRRGFRLSASAPVNAAMMGDEA